ncbi:MAG TPA: zf-TFIIB domain-containing protein [Acidimicrobiales bacterium]
MKCPVCDVTLSVSGREGVEIDFCPQCRGVWLDRGELDKIIERTNAALASAGPGRGYDDDRRAPRDYDRDYERGYDDRRYDERRRYDDDYDDRRYYGKRKKRRGGFLEDLFDFD